jgi:DNA-binding NarL/FixJ family response regulator
MAVRHFLLQAVVPWPALARERWQRAFPGGQARHWVELPHTLAGGDTIWVPVMLDDWLPKVAALVQSRPDCQVVVLSSVPDQVEGLRALNAGARGYCHLLAAPVLLQEVAQVVSLGGLWVGPDLVQRLMAATRELLQRSPEAVRPMVDLSVLSERELQVARAVAEGQSNREVAEQLHISERTVKAHLGAVFEKLGLRDRVQLVLQLAQMKSYAY